MATKNYRIEKDSLGEVKVPKKALWGAQTQRAVENFPISGIKMNFPFTKSFVSSLGLIKDAAARANSKLKLLMDKMQPSDPKKDEDFMLLTGVSYHALCKSADLLDEINIRPWENKNNNQGKVTI